MDKMEKDDLLKKIEETALKYELTYHGCSRCSFRAIQEHLNLGGGDSPLLASTPLAGGIALKGDTCGAMLGALLAIGLEMASPNMEDEGAFWNSMIAGYRFHRRFVREVGSSLCRDIQTARLGRYFSFTDLEEYEKAKKAGLYDVCSKVVAQAARIGADFILEMREQQKKARISAD